MIKHLCGWSFGRTCKCQWNGRRDSRAVESDRNEKLYSPLFQCSVRTSYVDILRFFLTLVVTMTVYYAFNLRTVPCYPTLNISPEGGTTYRNIYQGRESGAFLSVTVLCD